MKNFTASLFLIVFFVVGAGAQTDVHQIDFQNFTYQPYCADVKTEKLVVKNGEFSSEKQEDGYVDRLYFKVFDPEFGDLNGDGKDEAVVLSVCNTGGTGNFSEGFIYQIKNGKPALLARIPGGDRADGGLRSAKVERNLLVVEANDPGEFAGSCCPEIGITTRYKLIGARLIATGKRERRELYPKERVSFPKGASGTTVKFTIPPYERKRFVVGARAGQTLSVSVNTDQASVRLLEDAETTESANGFIAKLSKNGDQTVEVQNSAETETEITLTFKIK